MASYDHSSTNSSSYFNIPNIQSRLVPFKQLRERTQKIRRNSSSLALQQQETTQPIPVPRCKCPGSSNYISRSPIPGWTEPENQTQQRSCLSSFHGEDLLKIIELCYQEPSEPQPTNEQNQFPNHILRYQNIYPLFYYIYNHEFLNQYYHFFAERV